MINKLRTRGLLSSFLNIKSCKMLLIMISNRIRWLTFQTHRRKRKWYPRTSKTIYISKMKGRWWEYIRSRWPLQPKSATELCPTPPKMHLKRCTLQMSKKLENVAANLTPLVLFSRKPLLQILTKRLIASSACHLSSWTPSSTAKQRKTTQLTTSTFWSRLEAKRVSHWFHRKMWQIVSSGRLRDRTIARRQALCKGKVVV